jgi:hypothetical protein
VGCSDSFAFNQRGLAKISRLQNRHPGFVPPTARIRVRETT